MTNEGSSQGTVSRHTAMIFEKVRRGRRPLLNLECEVAIDI